MCEVPSAMAMADDPEPFLEERWSMCFVCGRSVHVDHVAFWVHDKNEVVCMGCEKAKIDVWRVSLPGDSGGYYDRDFDTMADGLRHMAEGESLTVHKEKILALKYLSLPEFQGF